jgi:diguanylate cyclase (GGDEF)-like protein/PAS domain S-box-containing protein/putative nucleotidyltransferase with HDIG domain
VVGIMDENFYKNIVNLSPVGYALHRIVLNDAGEPVDYVYLEANRAFESFTGLDVDKIRGKSVTEILPEIIYDEYNWIAEYGKVAIEGKEIEFEQYSQPLHKWYRVKALSPGIGLFITYFTDITEEMKNLEQKTTILSVLNEIVFEIDEDLVFINVISDENKLFYPKDKILGSRISDVLSGKTGEKFIELLKRAKQSKSKVNLSYLSPIEGDERWFRAEAKYIEFRNINKYVVGIQDITNQKRAEDDLKSIRDEYRKVFHGTQDSMFLIEVKKDDSFRYMRNNLAHRKNTGISLQELRGKTPKELLGEEAAIIVEGNYRRCIKEKTTIVYEETLKLKTGTRVWNTSLTPVFQEGEISYIVGSSHDITEKKQRQLEIEYLSYRDQLTGLYNRRFFEEELKRLDTPRNLPLSIAMVDVNGLKLANDAFGHESGDEMLIKIAEVMKRLCRADDIISRIGGDEFIVLLPKTDASETKKIAERISEGVKNETTAAIPLSVSCGFSVKVSTDKDISAVIKKAEERMYVEKLRESPKLKLKTIQIIMRELHRSINGERDHSQNVGDICERLAIEIGFNKQDARYMRYAGYMHDIGKVGIDSKIFEKEGKLTEEEWLAIKRHSETGYRIMSSVNQYASMADYILSHHEKWDGSGYPAGMKNDSIPIESRIISIADAYHAMTQNRSYRNAMTSEEALEEIQNCKGSHFDPYIADVFIEMIKENPA